MIDFESSVRQWLFDPTTGKIVTALVGLLAIAVITSLVNHSVARYVDRSTARYRLR